MDCHSSLSPVRCVSPVIKRGQISLCSSFFSLSTSTKIRKGHPERQPQTVVTSLIETLTKYLYHNTHLGQMQYLDSLHTARILFYNSFLSAQFVLGFFFRFTKTGTRGQSLHLPWMTVGGWWGAGGETHPSSKDKVHTTDLFSVQSMLIICVWLMTSAYSHGPIKLDQWVCTLARLVGSVHVCVHLL